MIIKWTNDHFQFLQKCFFNIHILSKLQTVQIVELDCEVTPTMRFLSITHVQITTIQVSWDSVTSLFQLPRCQITHSNYVPILCTQLLVLDCIIQSSLVQLILLECDSMQCTKVQQKHYQYENNLSNNGAIRLQHMLSWTTKNNDISIRKLSRIIAQNNDFCFCFCFFFEVSSPKQ